LKKSLIAVGLSFLVIGFITIVWAATFYTEVVLSNKSWKNHDTWEISGDFKKGNRLVFYMIPGKFWFGEPLGPDAGFPFDAAIFIDVSIIDPKGGKTVFTAVYAQVPTQQPFPKWELFGAEVKSNDGGLIIEENTLWWKADGIPYYNYYGHPSIGDMNGFGGIVKYDGEYKVIVNQERSDKPTSLELFRQEISFEQPFLFLIPIGATILSAGAALGIWGVWGVRKSKYRTRRLKTKRK